MNTMKTKLTTRLRKAQTRILGLKLLCQMLREENARLRGVQWKRDVQEGLYDYARGM